MQILFWVPPWAAHGDPLFYLNSVKKHLIPQANTLAKAGCSVDFVLPELMKAEKCLIDSKVNIIDFEFSDQIDCFNNFSDPSVDLYLRNDENRIEKIANKIKRKINNIYDVIFLWETPVPFLNIAFPDSLIIHQMPGAFSRAPYPSTVTFDPIGLYRQGAINLYSDDIKSGKWNSKFSIADEFSHSVRQSINSIQPFDREILSERKFEKIRLLPLQVTSHYSFLSDTNYRSQADFLMDVLSITPDDVGLVVTQYVTPRVSDTVLNSEVFSALKNKYPNLIFREDFDRIGSVSQLLLPLVDEVVTCSSSIGFQGMSWSRDLLVMQETFMKPYSKVEGVDLASFDQQKIYTNTLDFILKKNQPLTSLVVDDAKFLLGIIQEMIYRKRSGLKGIDLMPDFNEIDPKYSSKLINSFNVERAAKGIENLPSRLVSKQEDIGKFRRALNDKTIKVVTFDLFDTLVKRPTEVPADVFKFLEKQALDLTDGVAEDFARVRQASEMAARDSSVLGEVTLDEIYKNVKKYYDLQDDVIELLIQKEIDLELDFIKPRPLGEKLFQMAVNSRKPIYIVSDMYLSLSTIEQILDNCGYTQRSGIFLSSIYGVRKKEGELFNVVLNNLNVNSNNILHVGDNKVADIEQATKKGLKTFRLLRAIDRMRGNEYYKNIFPAKSGLGEVPRSVLAGLIAGGLFEHATGELEKKSLFQGDPFNMGYAAVGPIISGFMLWLGRKAKKDKISKLYFLSREGWILKRVYDELHKNEKDAVPSFYLYASRRSTRVAGLRNKGDILALAGHPYKAGVSLEVLLKSRFGINPELIELNSIKEAGYFGIGDFLETDPKGRAKFSHLCGLISNIILENAREESAGYSAYLDKTGFKSDLNAAIVDVGWKANMQGALGNLVNRTLNGYYYATLQGAEMWLLKGHNIKSYSGDMLSHGHPSSIVCNRPLFEYLTCHVEQSLVSIKLRDDGSLQPIFRPEYNLSLRKLFIEKVHSGVVAFSRDLCANYSGKFNQIFIEPFLAERVFSSFVDNPSKYDAELLIGHSFEDALAGTSKSYIINPNAKLIADSVWKAGAAVAFSNVLFNSEKTNVASPVKLENSNNLDENESKPLIIRIEKLLVDSFCSLKKINKYEKDRNLFFIDSKNNFIRKYYELTNRIN